jgi:predicted Ser/Thr protein kinase
MLPSWTHLAVLDARLEASRILLALFLWVAAFHLHLAWRERRMDGPFWFGVVAFCMALREWPESDWMPEGPEPWRLGVRVSWAALLLGSMAFIQFLWPFLGRPVTRFLRGYQAFLFGVMGTVLLLPTPTLGPLLRHAFWVEVPLLLMFPVLLLRQVRAGHPEARTLAFGTLWLTLGSFHEVGYWLKFWPNAKGLTWGFGLFMVSMAFSISNHFLRIRSESEALNRDLEQRVAERTQALEEAQARILGLSERASDLRDPLTWTHVLESELRGVLGGAQLTVWRWDGTAFLPLGAGGTPPDPGLAEHLRRGPLDEPGSSFVPVAGPGVGLGGVIVVEGKPGPWKESERRLVATFAGHLAGALELARLREELDQADARRGLERQVLIDDGSGALQVCPLCAGCFDHRLEACPEDRSPLAFSRAFPYRVNGRYRLTRFLGEGATAQVFEAEDERLGRRVALKAIKPDHFHRESSRKRFEQEARALAQLTHPSVLAIFDSGELTDGTVFLVTERLLGAGLGRVLQTFGPGRPDQVARLVLAAAAALDAAHGAGLLHRDLKPDNIFVLPSPLRFKLLDFGLAKEIAEASNLTHTGIVMGTPIYMSPEQIQGLPMDARSDLYSLGLVAWEALTGTRVVRSGSLSDIIFQIVATPPPSLRDRRPDLPAHLDEAFALALAKLPQSRAERCGTWAQGFAQLLATCPSSVPGWPETLGDLPHSAQAATTLAGDDPTRHVSQPGNPHENL